MRQRMWEYGAALCLALVVMGGVGVLIQPVAAGRTAPPVGAGAAPAGGCVPSWAIVNSPNPTTADSVLEGMTAIAANDVWAVGWYDSGANTPRTMTQHWDGTAWSIVPSPNLGSPEDVLQAVDGVSANDVWAVGLAGTVPMAMHWDGNAWSLVPVPSNGIYTNELKGVAAVASNDVWAVGEYYAGVNPSDRLPLILHWDGLAWSVVPSPALPATYLWGATAISANDVWAVGFSDTEAVALHWDGTAWTQVAVPQYPFPPTTYVLYSVSGAASNDVWAVGIVSGGGNTVTMHWDGTAWSVVPSPSPWLSNYLYAVAAVQPGEAWAVGLAATGVQSITLIEHWDGTAWSVVPSPNPPTGNPFLAAAAVVGATDVWAAGAYFDTGSARQTLIEHYTNPCSSPTPTVTATGTVATATLTPTPATATVTPTPPPQRQVAHLCLSLRQDPDTAVPPGGLVTYTLALVNQGPAEGDAASVHLPLDPNLEVLDARTSNPRIYVDWLDAKEVAVRFHDLGVGAGGTVQIVARVRPTASVGATITSRGEAVWYDMADPHQSRYSNSVTLAVGPLADGGLHGLRQALTVDPAGPVTAGTGLVFAGGFFAEEEGVSVWLNRPDGTVTTVTERARTDMLGAVLLPLDTRGLAAGTYTLVAHGWCSGAEGVGVFTVR